MTKDSLLGSTRRRFMALGAGTAVGGSALLSGSGSANRGNGAKNESAKTGNDDHAEAVDAGLAYFQSRSHDQLPLAETLLEALKAGDETRAKDAYIDSRPPYEEIEVLAASFPETDADMDARPTSYTYGETSEEFVGFHKIERLLYRDDDLEGAIPYAKGLVETTDQLQDALEQRNKFDPVSSFEGMIGLANEVPTKKITSEEETFSGQSLLIFQHNWMGIYSQFKPFATAVESTDEKTATEVRDAKDEALSIVAPYFRGNQTRAAPYETVNEDVRGEIVRASYRFRDALIDSAAALDLNTSWNK